MITTPNEKLLLRTNLKDSENYEYVFLPPFLRPSLLKKLKAVSYPIVSRYNKIQEIQQQSISRTGIRNGIGVVGIGAVGIDAVGIGVGVVGIDAAGIDAVGAIGMHRSWYRLSVDVGISICVSYFDGALRRDSLLDLIKTATIFEQTTAEKISHVQSPFCFFTAIVDRCRIDADREHNGPTSTAPRSETADSRR